VAGDGNEVLEEAWAPFADEAAGEDVVNNVQE